MFFGRESLRQQISEEPLVFPRVWAERNVAAAGVMLGWEGVRRGGSSSGYRCVYTSGSPLSTPLKWSLGMGLVALVGDCDRRSVEGFTGGRRWTNLLSEGSCGAVGRPPCPTGRGPTVVSATRRGHCDSPTQDA